MDKYERIRMLGSGTFGKAWLVRDKDNRELYVIKEIRVAKKRELDEALSEAELLSKLNHTGVIRYREVLRTGSKIVHIVMEYAANGDLQARVNRNKLVRKPMPEAEVLRWFVQLCRALAHIHQNGMVHRDVKLANVFLAKDDRLKIGDFGIARVLERNAVRISARTCETPVGTPMYMAPELCDGKPYGQKADVWATGCLLYELMALKPAFIAQSMEGLMARIRKGRFDRDALSGYSPELQTVVAEMLSSQAELRPSFKDILKRPFLEAAVEAEALQAQAPAPAAVLHAGGDQATPRPARNSMDARTPSAAIVEGLAPVRPPRRMSEQAGGGLGSPSPPAQPASSGVAAAAAAAREVLALDRWGRPQNAHGDYGSPGASLRKSHSHHHHHPGGIVRAISDHAPRSRPLPPSVGSPRAPIVIQNLSPHKRIPARPLVRINSAMDVLPSYYYQQQQQQQQQSSRRDLQGHRQPRRGSLAAVAAAAAGGNKLPSAAARNAVAGGASRHNNNHDDDDDNNNESLSPPPKPRKHRASEPAISVELDPHHNSFRIRRLPHRPSYDRYVPANAKSSLLELYQAQVHARSPFA